jgi:hypothetical protein
LDGKRFIDAAGRKPPTAARRPVNRGPQRQGYQFFDPIFFNRATARPTWGSSPSALVSQETTPSESARSGWLIEQFEMPMNRRAGPTS